MWLMHLACLSFKIILHRWLAHAVSKMTASGHPLSAGVASTMSVQPGISEDVGRWSRLARVAICVCNLRI